MLNAFEYNYLISTDNSSTLLKSLTQHFNQVKKLTFIKVMPSTTQSKQHLVIGVTQLVVGTISIICGIVAMSKLTSPGQVTIGIWALYFAIPGCLCIVASKNKTPSMMGLSLAANIVGIILSGLALIIGSYIWAIMASRCIPRRHQHMFDSTYTCACYKDEFVHYYDASCDDVKFVKGAVGAATIMHLILMIVSFVGSIFGCIGTCCATREPTVIVGTVPANAITMTTPGYSPPAYMYTAQQGYPQQGHPQQGYHQQGYPQNAYPGGVVQLKAHPGGETSQQAHPGDEVPQHT